VDITAFDITTLAVGDLVEVQNFLGDRRTIRVADVDPSDSPSRGGVVSGSPTQPLPGVAGSYQPWAYGDQLVRRVVDLRHDGEWSRGVRVPGHGAVGESVLGLPPGMACKDCNRMRAVTDSGHNSGFAGEGLWWDNLSCGHSVVTSGDYTGE
jgi:hypothetical protein